MREVMQGRQVEGGRDVLQSGKWCCNAAATQQGGQEARGLDSSSL